jgi:hypothetical protein
LKTLPLHRLIYSLPLFVALLALFQNCAPSEQVITTAEVNAQNAQHYFQSTPKVVIDVFYEPGAEPFTGNTAQGSAYWSILEDNLSAIFQFRSAPPSLVVPKALSSMRALPAQNKTEWTGMDLVQLNSRQAVPSPGDESHFQVYFLNGNYSNGSAPQPSVIGVSLGGTTIIAIFKSVVRSTGTAPNGPVPKFVEQSTLVHEMGHALGFVNNGVPLTSSYQDTAHGSHSLNEECVMYWQNEGAGNLTSFIQKYMSSSSRVMWGPEVLQDARSISR